MRAVFLKILGKWILIILMLASMSLFSGCNKNANSKVSDCGISEEKGIIEVKTEYTTLQYPVEFDGKLTHTEVVQDGVALEVFMGLVGDEEREVFRIYFNDASQGAVVGYIIQGAQEIPVSYYVCEYEEELKTDSMKKDYYALMDAFEAIMNSIYEDPQYSADRYEKPVGTKDVKLKYWELKIPDNVYFEETENETLYRVNFYGIINDIRIDLYAVGWGEMEKDYSLDTIMVEGTEREIHVRIYDIPERSDWNEVDYNRLYRMLESVNTVTEIMLESK